MESKVRCVSQVSNTLNETGSCVSQYILTFTKFYLIRDLRRNSRLEKILKYCFSIFVLPQNRILSPCRCPWIANIHALVLQCTNVGLFGLLCQRKPLYQCIVKRDFCIKSVQK